MNLSKLDKIKQVQRNLGTRPDGDPGVHTWDCFYRATTPKDLVKTPYSLKAFGNWIHIAKPEDVKPFDPQGKGLKYYPNSVSGSFSANHKPVSIMVADGKTIRDYSCHCWEKKPDGSTHFPESVLWYNKNGTWGIDQVTKDVHLPDRDNILWAIGGAGIKPGDSEKEYFTAPFNDVWRRTSHIAISIDQFGYFIAVEMENMNRSQGLELLDKLGLKNVVWLDGGHVTSAYTSDHRRNVYTGQHYAIRLGG